MFTAFAWTNPVLSGRWGRVARRRVGVAALVALLLVALTGFTHATSPHARSAHAAATAAPQIVLAFQTMIGNSGPYVGSAGALRNIPAGGAPWKITSAFGVLESNGRLFIRVHGLTLLNNTNPVPNFQGAVSCQSIGSGGQATIANVFTPNATASATGDSVISATVTLPSPCFAPLVFVTSPAPQAWFAVSGM
jgi:hypothetical protein